MKRRKKITEEDMLYYFFLGTFAAAVVTAAVFSISGWNLPKTQCGLRKMTGFYCPGCGGTRAVWYLIHGQIRTSLYYNPAIVYTAVVIGSYLISQTSSRIAVKIHNSFGCRNSIVHSTHSPEGVYSGKAFFHAIKKVPRMQFHIWWCYVGAAILIGNFLWKNYYLIVKGTALIP